MTRKNEVPASEGKISVHIKQRLNVPLVSMAHQSELWCRVDGAMVVKQVAGLGSDEQRDMVLLPVTECISNERKQLICSAVIKSVLEQAGKIEGRYFLFRQGVPIPGKRYRSIDVFETDAPPVKS